MFHPIQGPLAEEESIQRFFCAKKNTDDRVPTTHQLENCDVIIIIKYVRDHWGDSKDISIKELQLKTVIFLGVATMA